MKKNKTYQEEIPIGNGYIKANMYLYAECIKDYFLYRITYYNKYGMADRPERDRPTHIQYYEDGTINCIKYFKDGKPHRDNNLPSYYKFEEKKLVEMTYFYNGKRHRDNDKPCIIEYNNQGEVIYENYFCHGINIKEDVLKRLKRKEIIKKTKII